MPFWLESNQNGLDYDYSWLDIDDLVFVSVDVEVEKKIQENETIASKSKNQEYEKKLSEEKNRMEIIHKTYEKKLTSVRALLLKDLVMLTLTYLFVNVVGGDTFLRRHP